MNSIGEIDEWRNQRPASWLLTMNTRGLFITGTDTDVGKTYVAALIAQQLTADGISVGAYKPACSGSELDEAGRPIWRDVEILAGAIGTKESCERICPQCFAAALAPPVAAQREGRVVDTRLLRDGARWWDGRVDVLIVEGVGGWLCPISENETVADVAADLGYPVLIVARLGLGTINHTLLTIESIKRRGLSVAGIILNECERGGPKLEAETNPGEIARRSGCPVLAVVRPDDTPQTFADRNQNRIDFGQVAQ